MAKSSSEIFESSRFFGSMSASVPFKSFLSKSKQKASSAPRSKFPFDSENISPIDPNSQIGDPPLCASVSFPKKSPSKVKINPLKEEVSKSVVEKKAAEAPDSPVKVAVRIRPTVGEAVLRKVSNDSLSIAERNFTFDAVFNSDSTQEDVYQLLGAPVVNDALCGYNTSIIAYGETGSGKTHTMWGPPSVMVDDPTVAGLQGIAPRIFQDLFSKIQKEQGNSDGRQINYQCRCSFLEVYDQKIGDLLDPTQKDLEIKDDVKNGFYVDHLTEEYVTCYKDITQILIKGLSNRKMGATKVNSESSRSHIMFTCIIESWCKDSSSKCFGSSKISRICLVDLAGFERNVPDNASKLHLKEGKFIKKSMSQIGNLVNIRAGETPPYKLDEDPYRSSRLTHLLRESFGCNTKLSVICTITPDHKSSSESIRTLRFGLRAKLLKNEPVVNEISEDDANGLSDQIRQLKEELLRAKSSTYDSISSNSGYFRGGNVRESLNQLRRSINRSLILPCIENDSEGNLCIGEEDVKELKLHLEGNMKGDFENRETDFTSEHYLSSSDESEAEEIYSTENQTEMQCPGIVSHLSTVLEDPVLSDSPDIKDFKRKSLAFTQNHLSVEEDAGKISKNLDVIRRSMKPDEIKSSLRSSRILQITDHHRSSVSFSFDHLALKPCLTADKANDLVQCSPEECLSNPPSATLVCTRCQGRSSGKDMERDKELSRICKDQAAQIELLNKKLEQYKCMIDDQSTNFTDLKDHLQPIIEDKPEFLTWTHDENKEPESFTSEEREALQREIEMLRNKLQFHTDTQTRRSCLLSQSFQLRKSSTFAQGNSNSVEEVEKERQQWMEMESEWISLTDELRIEIEANRQRAEEVEMQLKLEKKRTEELDDVLKRSVENHARMIEHYAELQEKYNEVGEKHRATMEGIVELKRAACKAGANGRHGSRFAKALSAELSALRVEKERERELLKKENRSLKIQLKDTAEAVHAAGEVLVRLREAEAAASLAEEKNSTLEEENEKLRKQVEKVKRKHKMEMISMKQNLAESRLPEAALRPSSTYREESSVAVHYDDDGDEAWRAEFGPIYQELF